MIRATKKLVMSFLGVLIIFTVLVSSTYAWFYSDNTSEISDIGFSVYEKENYFFSIDDGNTWVKYFSGEDIYKKMEKNYPEYRNLYYELVNTGSVANPVYEKNYKYTYRLVTPLATSTGFVSAFFQMEHTTVDDKVAFIFHNQSNVYEDEQLVRNIYNPESGYIKFDVKVKSDIDALFYLNDYKVNYLPNSKANDYASTSLLRIGFESDLYNVSKNKDGSDNLFYVENECEEVDGTKTNLLKHIKVFEPVKRLPDVVASYIGGEQYLNSSTRLGRYFSIRYIDDFAYDMRKEGSLLVKNAAEDAYEFNTLYNNIYGNALDKWYNLKYLNETIDNKYSQCLANVDVDSSNHEQATPIMMLEAGVPQDLTIYIWIEGWDGAACDFSQLGDYSISFSFM